MRDIENRTDIEKLLESFYKRAFADDMIGHFFTEVVPLNLEIHTPLIADFWESVVFGKRGYSKNVMQVHQHIHNLQKIEKQHLERWVKLFITTIEELHAGNNAELMKQRAISIANLMNIKLNHSSIK